MCIAILNKQGKINIEYLINSAKSNPDGGGICWIENDELKIFKSLNGNSVIDKYCSIRENNNLPVMIHFRISTSGLINVENCHPFKVHKNLAMCHNGILYTMDKKSEISDTRHFNLTVLMDLPEDFLENNALKFLLEKYIGKFNKLIFLNSSGKFDILNEDSGNWDKDKENWYSNDSYKREEKVIYFNNESSYTLPSDEKNLQNPCDKCKLTTSQCYGYECLYYNDYFNKSLKNSGKKNCEDCKDYDCGGCPNFKDVYSMCDKCKRASFENCANCEEKLKSLYY